MTGVVKYAAVNAKVRGLMGKMLYDEDYRKLINLESVQEIFDYLYNNTFYREALTPLAGIEIHRRQLELTLKKSFINDYEVIYRYLTGSTKEFFAYFFAKFEIEDLKMLLRTILIEHDEEYLRENLLYLGVHTEDISVNRLTEIKSYQDLLNVFQDTRYYDTLKRFAERYEKDRNLFPIEMTLDFNYFTELARLAGKLSKKDYKIVRDLLGTQVDLLNIHWVYRIKKYYNLDPEEILNYTLPFHYRLSADDLRGLARVDDPEEIFNYLKQTRYNTLFSPVARNKDILFEKYFLSYLLKKAYRIKVAGTFNIGIISAYLYIKEYEIRDIITIVEGVRYSLESEQIRKYLIRDWV